MLWWPAPAKLNLMLRIVGRRADGYHKLQTVFQLLDFGDRLAFAPRPDGLIRKLDPPPGVPEDNGLAVRAARLLQQVSGTTLGTDIRLDKRLPLGGGVGGGSSDAATTLVVLNHLWGTGLNEDQLAELGRQLGADVPVFVRGRSAWAEGVGDQLTPIDLPERWYVVTCPSVHVSTAELFADPKLPRDMPRITLHEFWNGEHDNAFEPVAVRRYPIIAKALEMLRPFGEPHLTGTGACVFCACADYATAEWAKHSLPAGWTSFTARGVNRSPLHLALMQQA
ncbi:MAG: 4-(cytidine 5'-diphospho)-2-C-methyl-D-erythritol kinase [Gammaproteobacteria bacterium]|nr:4-(cytidine 5'-diphospho)-2-C-methyl-D-erythritol kinase [Gammaproteobacteria bacterium]